MPATAGFFCAAQAAQVAEIDNAQAPAHNDFQ
jgi:hypothetical protein